MYMTFSPEIEYKWRGDTLVDWITVQLDAENSKLLLTSEFNELLTARRATLEVTVSPILWLSNKWEMSR